MSEATTMMEREGLVVDLELGGLRAHPRNREFPREGEVWEKFCENIAQHGVLEPVIVREMPRGPFEKDWNGEWEIVSGHRRCEAAARAGFETVPCRVLLLKDSEALELLLIANLQREDLDAYEEARGVGALLGDGMSAEEVAGRISRSVTWVRTRQLLLELGDEEVREALKRPRTDRRHLEVEALEPVLGLPEELRPQAVQLLLNCDLYDGPVPAAEAAKLVRQGILEPWQARTEWEGKRAALAKAWRAVIKKLLPTKDEKESLVVQAVPWEKVKDHTGCVNAEALVPADELTDAAPEGLTWARLAVRHGQTIKILPGEKNSPEESRAVVSETVLRGAEDSYARAKRDYEESRSRGVIRDGVEEREFPAAWVGRKKSKKTEDGQTSDARLEEEAEETADEKTSDARLEEAKAAVEGESSPAWEAEEERRAEEFVVEQAIERSVCIDMGPVMRVRAWAQGLDAAHGETITHYEDWCEWARGKEAGMPEWAMNLAYISEPNVVLETCDWIEGLKWVPRS